MILAWLVSFLMLSATPAGGSTGGVGRPPAGLTPARTFPLRGVRGPADTTRFVGRIDHLAYDRGTGRLFVAALANNSVEVIDLDKGERIRSITGLKKPQGIAIATSAGQAVVACGGDDSVHAFDTRTLEEKATAAAGENADNVRYDVRADRLYIGYGKETPGALMVFDPRTLKKVGEVPLPKRPESFQLDPAGGRVFANMPGAKRADTDGVVVAVDRAGAKVLWSTTLERTARNFPLAYDATHDRLFLASRKPSKLIAIDAKTGRTISEVPCVPDSDDLFHDARTNRVIVIGGGTRYDDGSLAPATQAAGGDTKARGGEDAAVDVFRVGPKGELTRIASIGTAPHARTGLFVADRRAVYVAVPPQGNRDSEIREYKLAD